MYHPNLFIVPNQPNGAAHGTPNNLPAQLTPLVGREVELEAVHELLGSTHSRLFTFIGPGGVGKTRLALEIARDLMGQFVDGVYIIELAAITDPGLALSSVAQTLGLKEMAGQSVPALLQEYLRHKQILLILDNFEHLTPAGPALADLLAACPNLILLVTSQAALHLRGEQEFEVRPLALPDIDKKRLIDPSASLEQALDMLSKCASVALFVRRASAIKSDFQLNSSNAEAIAEICIRLDGLPLAIELAAARIKLLSPQALLARLVGAGPASPLQLLTGGAQDLPVRQQTLRNTIEWSYSLLDTSEQQLFRMLSVFAGGCTFTSAEVVCGIGGRVRKLGEGGTTPSLNSLTLLPILDGLASLVDKSLLRQIDQGDEEPRLVMLQTIREYGLKELEASGEADALHMQYARYFLDLVEEAEPQLRGPQQVEWLNRLEAEHDNIRAVMEWSLASPQRAEIGLRMAGALLRFWQVRGLLNEGRNWVERALKNADIAQQPQWKVARAKALIAGGRVAFLSGEYAASRLYYEESLSLNEELGDRRGITVALMGLGGVALDEQNIDLARKIFEECLVVFREVGDKLGISGSLNNLGLVAMFQGDYNRSKSLLEECLTTLRELGDKDRIVTTVANLGRLAMRQGDYARAKPLIKESLALVLEMNDTWGLAYCLAGLAEVACGQGNLIHAARLLGASHAADEGIPSRLDRVDRADYDRCMATLRTRLGDAAFETALTEGKAMSVEQVLAEPELVLPSSPATTTKVSNPNELTVREIEVLRLVALGLTDVEVAAQLFLSRHTINTHLRSIYGKLGVTSRSAATRYATENNLV